MDAERHHVTQTDDSPAARLLDEADPRELCPACQGAGRVREWSTFFALAAVGGVGGLGFSVYRALTGGGFSWGLGLASFCVAIFGLFMLIDRGECEQCSGMGRMEQEDAEDADDAPWARAEPPM